LKIILILGALQQVVATRMSKKFDKKSTRIGFQCLEHPPYSPDLAPSEYHLFHGLKKQLEGRDFSSNAEVIAAAGTWLDGQPSAFFWWLAKV
jgi:histone-lysine N-methyltransferase SETMAR